MSDDLLSTSQDMLTALGSVYHAHVTTGSRYALVDFPDHANVGDSAIWLGEITMLRQITGRDPCYVSTWHDFDHDAFRAACPDGVLFLHGGGNLGDIWPHHQHFREQILSAFPDRTIVQLPQSIHFREPSNATRFAAIAGRHPHFTLHVRDRRSLTFARRHLGCPAILAPDSAYAMARPVRGTPDCDVLMLMRTDDERRDHADPVALPASSAMVDWLEDEPGLPPGTDPVARTAQAMARVDRGLRLLSRGRVVITDRLHGHILADLLRIPHVVLDNEYGKIAAYMEAWPAASSSVAVATTMAQAMAQAERMTRLP